MPIGKKAEEKATKMKAKEEKKKAKQEQEKKIRLSKKKGKAHEIKRFSREVQKNLSQLSIASSPGEAKQNNEEEEYEYGIPVDVFNRYIEQIKASDGFDVEDLSDYDFDESGSHFVPLNSQYYFNLVIPLAKMAIDRYNEEQNTKFRFLEIEKLNSFGFRITIYYITFKAVDEVTTETKSFEAEVEDYFAPPSEIEVSFCRLKRTATSPIEGIGSSATGVSAS